MLRSSDAGTSWNDDRCHPVPATSSRIRMIDEKTFFLVGDGGLYVTNNGGGTWTELYGNTRSGIEGSHQMRDVDLLMRTSPGLSDIEIDRDI